MKIEKCINSGIRKKTLAKPQINQEKFNAKEVKSDAKPRRVLDRYSLISDY